MSLPVSLNFSQTFLKHPCSSAHLHRWNNNTSHFEHLQSIRHYTRCAVHTISHLHKEVGINNSLLHKEKRNKQKQLYDQIVKGRARMWTDISETAKSQHLFPEGEVQSSLLITDYEQAYIACKATDTLPNPQAGHSSSFHNPCNKMTIFICVYAVFYFRIKLYISNPFHYYFSPFWKW